MPCVAVRFSVVRFLCSLDRLSCKQANERTNNRIKLLSLSISLPLSHSSVYKTHHTEHGGLSKCLSVHSFYISLPFPFQWNNANFRFQLFDFKSLLENVFLAIDIITVFDRLGRRKWCTRFMFIFSSSLPTEILLEKFGPAILWNDFSLAARNVRSS